MENNSSKMIMFVVISLAVMAISIGLVYFLGGVVEEHFWVKGIKVEEWQSLYLKVVGITGGLVCLSSIIWIVRSSLMPSVTVAGHADPRPLWIILFVLSIAESLIVPFGLTFAGYIPHLHFANIILSAFIFMLGFYFVTVFGTPDKFKFAPLGASALRG